MNTENTLFWLPTPIFWGVLAAWIPIPPSILVGFFFAIITYALLSFLLSLRDWEDGPEVFELNEPLIPSVGSQAILNLPNIEETGSIEAGIWEKPLQFVPIPIEAKSDWRV